MADIGKRFGWADDAKSAIQRSQYYRRMIKLFQPATDAAREMFLDDRGQLKPAAVKLLRHLAREAGLFEIDRLCETDREQCHRAGMEEQYYNILRLMSGNRRRLEFYHRKIMEENENE